MNASADTPRRVARVAVPVPLEQLFDYGIPDSAPLPAVGARILVPFGGRNLMGVCVEVNPPDAHAKLKPLGRILDEENFFGADLWALTLWLADYYQYPLGEVLSTVLPAAARRAEALPATRLEHWTLTGSPVDLSRAPRQAALQAQIQELGGEASIEQLKSAGFARSHIRALQAKGVITRATTAKMHAGPATLEQPLDRLALNAEQERAFTELANLPPGFAPVLLDGVTGSGKTEVYLRHIQLMLQAGRQVLVLVPEIALTPQTLARFEARFGRADVIHSNMTDRARLTTWLKAKRGELSILIGTRSAILTPFFDLGLIVVDEEHDVSFKQQDGLRYSARDVAVKRAQQLGIPLVLGSATPSFESLHNARTGRYRRLELTRRAGGAQMPGYNLLDLRGRQLDAGLSEELYSVIGRHLRAGNQALVFLNRRGFAPCLVCANCGWQAECPACERPLTLHRHPPALICHHCGRREPDATACPECGHNSLIPVGQGTQRAEAGLARHFPDVAVYRIDRDTTRSRSRLEAQLDAIREGAPAILVGTQMLAKGHHFPNVTLVAVVNADGGFLSPDFRAPERTAQLIVQVAGRAGREERPGEVYIQTYQPGNPQLRALIDSGYAGFADKELVTREAAALPPYCPIALLRAEAANAAAAESWLAHARGLFEDGLEVYGPAPAIIPRVADRWRYQLLITAPRRAVLHRGIRRFRATMEPARDVRWSLDIDPYDTF